MPPADLPPASREEICRVSLGAARNFSRTLAKKRKGAGVRRLYRWDPLGGTFVPANRPRPGDTLLLHSEAGGYDPALGFTGKLGTPVEAVVPTDDAEPGSRRSMEDDAGTTIGRWIRIEDHLVHVAREARSIVDGLGLPGPLADVVTTAARWHDTGKSHEAFQARLLSPLDEEDREARGAALWAKSEHRIGGRGTRPGFRHELASAIAWLSAVPGESDPQFRDLVAYLIAAHHGKVRLSIRSSPVERVPDEGDRRFARGVWDGDLLPAVELPGGGFAGPVPLDLSIIEMGEGSWIERTLALRDAPDLGPFRLACLEAVLRAADWRASGKEVSDATA